MKIPGRVAIFTSGLGVAALCGIFLVYVGASHNSQGEFYDFETGAWNISHTGLIFLQPVALWILLCSAALCVAYVVRRLRKQDYLQS